MDFVSDIFNLIPLKGAVVIMFLAWLASRNVKRDSDDRLPNWFPVVPFLMGLVGGVPVYLLDNAALLAAQAHWITFFLCLWQGLLYGAVAIGLWSARSLIPYFTKMFPNGKDK